MCTSLHTLIETGWHALTRPRGDRRWNLVLRCTALFSLAGIPIALYLPSHIPLVWLAVIGLPANGPISPILPVAFEPLVMEAARHRPVLEVTLVAWAVHLYMEYLNCHLYRWLLEREAVRPLRHRPLVKRLLRWFARSPFSTVVIVAMSPLPFWVIRVTALMHGYPIRRFMMATALGRFPRLYLYAWLGDCLQLPAIVLVTLVVGASSTTLIALRKRHARKEEPRCPRVKKPPA